MKLSVIIPSFNSAGTISSQLEALSTQVWSEPWEVIVSDNGSTDNTRDVVEKLKGKIPHLRIVDSSGRRGSAHARNVGATSARGEALAFCDSDDVVAPGWVDAMGNGLSVYDFVASRFEVKKLNGPGANRSHAQERGLQVLQYSPFMCHAGGSGLGVKKRLHEAVGGFDESLPRLMDTDYCLRVQMLGVELRFLPDAVVHVRRRSEYVDHFRFRRLWGRYNMLIFKKYRRTDDHDTLRQWLGYLRSWGRLCLRSPLTISREMRLSWVESLAGLIGKLEGAIRYKVPPI